MRIGLGRVGSGQVVNWDWIGCSGVGQGGVGLGWAGLGVHMSQVASAQWVGYHIGALSSLTTCHAPLSIPFNLLIQSCHSNIPFQPIPC